MWPDSANPFFILFSIGISYVNQGDFGTDERKRGIGSRAYKVCTTYVIGAVLCPRMNVSIASVTHEIPDHESPLLAIVCVCVCLPGCFVNHGT